MANEDFNSVDDILNQWVKSGPKEGQTPPEQHVDITVHLANGSRAYYPDAHIQDLGSRMIVADETGLTVYTEAAVLYYEVEPIEVDAD